AKSPPSDLASLRSIPGVSADQADRRGKEILATVKQALAIPEGDLPRIERVPRRPTDPAYEARVERLKQARNALATRYELAPGVLCPNGTLEAIARANPRTMDQLAAVPELRRWQLREFGGELLHVVGG
ncbi:MAG: HRDC domain-containing protein, partial [Gemmatimonadales bacterium]